MTMRRTTFAALVLLLAPRPGAAADAPGGWTPPVLKDARLTLADAVRITLENDPVLRVSGLRARGFEGAFVEQSGRFDAVLGANLSYSLSKTALASSQRAAERQRRTDLQAALDEATQRQGALASDVSDLQKLAANPTGYTATQPDLAQVQATVAALNAQIAATSDPAQKAALTAQRTQYLQSALADYGGRLTAQQQLVAGTQASLTALGDVPEIEEDQNAQFGLSLAKPFRSGLTLGLFADGSWQSSRYEGKPVDAALGGLGSQDLYRTEIGFSVDAALLRGRGVDATGAPERAARIDWEASRLTAEHQASQSVFTTLAAYWNLAAAQDLLDVVRRSAALHGRRLDLTKALIQADHLPRAELSRELASQASDEALVRSAERSVAEARLDLATAMGIQLTDADGPVAADPLPEAPDAAALAALDPAALVKAALDHRADRRAAAKLRESGGVLVRFAQTGLRPRLDFSGRLSAGAVGEGSLSNTSDGWAGPSWSVALDFEAPLGNREAKGRLAQAEAQLGQRSIAAVDLDRNIRANVVSVVATLRATAAQLARARDAVGLYGKTIDAETERFKAGQASLLDAIVTQDLQTNAAYTHVIARQQLATLLGRLRFETGTLVAKSGEKNVVTPGDLVSLPAVPR